MKTIAKDFKGTPGEWIERDGLIECGKTIASVNSFGIKEEESEANAKLFVQSKRMAEVLEKAHEKVRYCQRILFDNGYGLSDTSAILKEIESVLNDAL